MNRLIFIFPPGIIRDSFMSELYPLAGKLNLTGQNQLDSCNHVNRNLNLLLKNALLLGIPAGGV